MLLILVWHELKQATHGFKIQHEHGYNKRVYLSCPSALLTYTSPFRIIKSHEFNCSNKKNLLTKVTMYNNDHVNKIIFKYQLRYEMLKGKFEVFQKCHYL